MWGSDVYDVLNRPARGYMDEQGITTRGDRRLKHFKRMLWIIPLGFVGLGLIGQLLISTGVIPEKAGEPEVIIPTKTITPKPSIKPKEDPIDSWKKYKVNWNEYGDQLSVIIRNDFYAKDCQSLQDTFDLAVYTNPEHMAEYGHNNAKLMQYIDHLLKAANCYK